MSAKLAYVTLELGATNESLAGSMLKMKNLRARAEPLHVICCIGGFEADSRNLWEIPEVRAFCRRLVALGLIYYLDESTLLNPEASFAAKAGWGALEVWLCSEGRLSGDAMALAPADLDSFRATMLEAKRKAAALHGPA